MTAISSCSALRLARRQPGAARRFEHLLIDDAQELDLAPATLVRELAGAGLTVAGDPPQALRRFRGAGAARMRSFEGPVCGPSSSSAASAAPSVSCGPPRPGWGPQLPGVPHPGGAVELWRCANDRAQAQSVAVDIERLIAREAVDPGRSRCSCPRSRARARRSASRWRSGRSPHRLVGEAAFFQRAEIRDVLAWLRLLADPSDAGAVVRALARPPIELRSVDIARCTQIARRRKLDMVSALAAATESPAGAARGPRAHPRVPQAVRGRRRRDRHQPPRPVRPPADRSTRPAPPAAVRRAGRRGRAPARAGPLRRAGRRLRPARAAGHAARVRALDRGGGRLRAARAGGARAVAAGRRPGADVGGRRRAGGRPRLRASGCTPGVAAPPPEPIPDSLLREDAAARHRGDPPRGAAPGALRGAHPGPLAAGALLPARQRPRARRWRPRRSLEAVRGALGARGRTREEELFGPAETLHSTYRLLRDELLEGTMRAGGRLGELRFDTDLDVSHAVVRYLELLKLAALIARPEGQSVAEALRDVNSRILQAVTAEQREIFTSSALDDYLLDAERDARRRAQAIAARDEPSLEPFLPPRGDGVVLSASDIDTYRTCPLKYKFARVFRIPQEPTLHQRFGILVHQVLERFHADDAGGGTLPELLGLLDAGWRRGGFGDSEEERQLRGKAAIGADPLPRALPVRGGAADVVRAPVHVQARPASAARARRSRRPAARAASTS